VLYWKGNLLNMDTSSNSEAPHSLVYRFAFSITDSSTVNKGRFCSYDTPPHTGQIIKSGGDGITRNWTKYPNKDGPAAISPDAITPLLSSIRDLVANGSEAQRYTGPLRCNALRLPSAD